MSIQKTCSFNAKFLPLPPVSHGNSILTDPSNPNHSFQPSSGPSFSKARRFSIDHSLPNIGPGLYNPNPDSTNLSSARGANIGLGSKSPVIFPHLLPNPGPTSYNPVDLDNLKEKIIKGGKFPKSKHFTFEEEIKAAFGPPPGAYETNGGFASARKAAEKGTFSRVERFKRFDSQGNSLGPGDYQIVLEFILKNRMKFGERLGESKAAEWKSKMRRRLPGPGHYDIKDVKGGKNMRFGRSNRPEMFISRSVAPGPGAYFQE